MTALRTTSDYAALTLSQKFEAFDSGLPALLNEWKADEIYQLLEGIVLNTLENANLRKRALAALTDYAMLRKIKVRRALHVLIDAWPAVADIFLELQRLKDLYLFYSEEKTEIESIFLSYAKADEAEISAEANYRLGLIKLQQALEETVHEDRIVLLEQSYSCLAVANREVENRGDALFIKTVVTILRNALVNNWHEVNGDWQKLGNLLFEMQAKSFSFRQNVLFLALYRCIGEMQLLRSKNASTWLDFREELTKIYYHFSELQNQKIKDRLAESDVAAVFVDLVSTSFVEPYFTISLGAHLARVDARLLELEDRSPESQFLQQVRDLILVDPDKKKDPAETLKESLQRALPYRDASAIASTLKKVTDETDLDQIVNAYFELAKPDLNNLLNALVQACLRLQGNRLYRGDFSEDDRNTYIADMLIAGQYRVKDQPRWSKSAAGKSAGEIDIYVEDNKGLPYAIIEALNLDSLKSDYLILHIDKLFNYDTAGHPANFILVYCTAVRFAEFWSKYCNFIKAHAYKYPFQCFEEITDYKYANIKLCRTDHLREGQQVALYHIVLDMQSI
jgi:hypothetical protein